MKPDKKKETIEILLREFRKYHEQYPQGGFADPVARLQKQLADHNDRIGRKKQN
jgi:biotin-(acetyl-CoA carboxylase) ligase